MAAAKSYALIYLPTTFVSSLCFGGPELNVVCYDRLEQQHNGSGKGKDLGGAVFMRPVDTPGLPEPVITL
ncbi:hypothetical protein [Neomesorhizobium albiziae]|uniref:hypothetical protein n=1 Tax=Neomesorhizobium albiziae TaxID=335020 RepID=UPI001FCEE061|nr:hypothetical protein [Mesorhizobium albiziae]